MTTPTFDELVERIDSFKLTMEQLATSQEPLVKRQVMGYKLHDQMKACTQDLTTLKSLMDHDPSLRSDDVIALRNTVSQLATTLIEQLFP